jgi:hypothetical protein
VTSAAALTRSLVRVSVPRRAPWTALSLASAAGAAIIDRGAWWLIGYPHQAATFAAFIFIGAMVGFALLGAARASDEAHDLAEKRQGGNPGVT